MSAQTPKEILVTVLKVDQEVDQEVNLAVKSLMYISLTRIAIRVKESFILYMEIFLLVSFILLGYG